VSQVVMCRDVVELITAYLDDELPADLRAAVEAHLSGCDGCTMVLDEFRRTIELTGRLRDEDVSPEQRETLRRAFRDWATA
jgi:anti-sigma factor RsiW